LDDQSSSASTDPSRPTPFPAVPAPPDGQQDPAGEASNRAEVKAFLEQSLRVDQARLVLVSAGTNNDFDQPGAVIPCGDEQCIAGSSQALEIAW
jgi:hypothetical protein